MQKYKYITLSLTLISLALLTSCRKTNGYSQCSYEVAMDRLEKIRTAQKDDQGVYTLFDKGNLTYIDDTLWMTDSTKFRSPSYKKFDIYSTLNWSFKDKYIKWYNRHTEIEYEERDPEEGYKPYIISNYECWKYVIERDGIIYQCKKNQQGDLSKTVLKGFKYNGNHLMDVMDNLFCCIGPVNIETKLSGFEICMYFTPGTYVNYLFQKERLSHVNLTASYGSNDEQSAMFNAKGIIGIENYEEAFFQPLPKYTTQYTCEVDFYYGWQDNFIKNFNITQNEIKIDELPTKTKTTFVNKLQDNLEVEKGKCTIEDINIDEYKDEE